MTRSNFSVEKLQRKSARVVWKTIMRDHDCHEGWYLIAPDECNFMEMQAARDFEGFIDYCKKRNLVTVSQILKAIR